MGSKFRNTHDHYNKKNSFNETHTTKIHSTKIRAPHTTLQYIISYLCRLFFYFRREFGLFLFMDPLSVTIIITTYNEAHNIEAALMSINDWSEEIIVVDSFSTDSTCDIIRTKFPEIKLLQRAYQGPSDQKNWAIPQAKNKFILLMDADERATPEMRQEIESILKNPATALDAYWIGFTHFFMAQQVRYSGWQNDKTIRFIARDKCRYNNNRVHEEIQTEGLRIGFFKSKFLHYTYKDVEHFVKKQMRYARWSAEDHDEGTGQITLFHFVLKPFYRFVKHFFLKLGFLDGKVGFIISAVAAWSVFMRYVFLSEKRKKNVRDQN